MTTQPDPLAIINCARSVSMQNCIDSMTHPDTTRRRGIDFACIDSAIAAAVQLVESLGPDAVVPGMYGATANGLLIEVRGIAAQAEPYRPKARRA